MGSDVSDGAQRSTFAGQHTPVKIGDLVQPVLDVASGDMKRIAEVSQSNLLSGFDAHGVIANVVVDSRVQSGLSSLVHQRQAFLAIHC
jgi:hypothetical protein